MRKESSCRDLVFPSLKLENLNPHCRFQKRRWLRSPPPRQHVRHDLKQSRDAFHAAFKAAERLLRPRGLSQREASFRMIDADHHSYQEGGPVSDAFQSLSKVLVVMDQALADLPTAQTRKTASIKPLQRIEKALECGFIEDQDRQRADKELLDKVAAKGLPKYVPIEPARGGVYKKLVRIYYDAIGLQKGDPDHAIRKYIRWCEDRKKQRKLTRNKVKGAGGKNK